MIHTQISWGLWSSHTWWGHSALDCRHAGLCTVAIQKRLHKLCSWRSPLFPHGSNMENGGCRTGIVLFWSHLCGDSQHRGGIRRQGGNIWVKLQLAEAPWSIMLIHTLRNIQTDFHTHRNIYCRNITHRVWLIRVFYRVIAVIMEFVCIRIIWFSVSP